MTFVQIPPEEMPAVIAAMNSGNCVSCYKPAGDNGLYCAECDPPEDPA
jgi:hypothetical protein